MAHERALAAGELRGRARQILYEATLVATDPAHREASISWRAWQGGAWHEEGAGGDEDSEDPSASSLARLDSTLTSTAGGLDAASQELKAGAKAAAKAAAKATAKAGGQSPQQPARPSPKSRGAPPSPRSAVHAHSTTTSTTTSTAASPRESARHKEEQNAGQNAEHNAGTWLRPNRWNPSGLRTAPSQVGAEVSLESRMYVS